MSRRMLIAWVAFSMLLIGGVLKLIAREWQGGLLLIGFALMWLDDVRVRERLRALTTPPAGIAA